MARRLAAAVLAAALALSAAIVAAPANAQGATGTVTLVHGVRGLVADIYLDGAVALQVFQPERTAGPLNLPAGPHAVVVRTAGSPPTSTPLLSATLNIPAGSRQSAVVHLSATGQPAMTVYPDDLSTIPAGQTRVILRHAAAAPPIDVRIDQQVVASALPTAGQAAQQVAAGPHAVAVVSAAGQNLIAPNNVTFNAGSANFMYLVGSATDNSLIWLAHIVEGLGVAPFAVRSGGDLAAPPDFPYLRVSLLALVMVVLASIAAHSSRTPNRWMATRRLIAAGGVAASVAGVASASQSPRSGVVPDAGSISAPIDVGLVPAEKLAKLATLAPVKRDRPILGAIATRSARLEDRQTPAGPAPTSVAIEGFGIRAPIVAVGADPVTTEMDLPESAAVAAWYAPGPSPGQTGSAVLASHVAYHDQLGVFFGLGRVEPDARIRVDYDDGSTRWFIVTARRNFAKPDLPVEDLFRRDGLPALALITCGGKYDPSTRSYSDNVVIYARPETQIPLS